jgi:hypothetical protein
MVPPTGQSPARPRPAAPRRLAKRRNNPLAAGLIDGRSLGGYSGDVVLGPLLTKICRSGGSSRVAIYFGSDAWSSRPPGAVLGDAVLWRACRPHGRDDGRRRTTQHLMGAGLPRWDPETRRRCAGRATSLRAAFRSYHASAVVIPAGQQVPGGEKGVEASCSRKLPSTGQPAFSLGPPAAAVTKQAGHRPSSAPRAGAQPRRRKSDTAREVYFDLAWSTVASPLSVSGDWSQRLARGGVAAGWVAATECVHCVISRESRFGSLPSDP